MSQYTQLEQSMNTPYQHTLITIFNNPPSTPILPGDSCFPAITTEDTTSIFEEQEVVNSLADLVGGTEGDVGSKLDKLAVGKVIYAEKEKILAFGPITCGQPGTRGVMERIKISNPTKIDTKVKLRVVAIDEMNDLLGRPKDAKSSGGGGSSKQQPLQEIFSCQVSP